MTARFPAPGKSRSRAGSSAEAAPARVPATELAVPIGTRVLEVLEIAYRSRRPLLLEGPTGIGKSQIVTEFARASGIDVIVFDLSLLEPPDLIGLPVIEDGRTHYASPAELPMHGRGILMLEELNRAEPPVMQPALQLLSARRLHSYQLPDGWNCVAAINPEHGDYQVNRLDPALRTRFLQLSVCADRDMWMIWATRNNVHPVILRTVRDHEDVFEHASPRSWTYASDVLYALGAAELENTELVRVALRGFLPTAWSRVVTDTLAHEPEVLAIDVEALLAPGGENSMAELVLGLSKNNRIDAIAVLSSRLRRVLDSEALLESVRAGTTTLSSLETLVAPLPGDLRDQCLQTAVESASAPELLRHLGVTPAEIGRSYASSPLREHVRAWREAMQLHRVRLVVTGARRWLDTLEPDAPELKSAVRSLVALVQDAGVLAQDLACSLRARGVDPAVQQ